MSWKVEFLPQAERNVQDLDRPVARRIARFLFHRVAKLENPRSIGESLHGPELGELWKYRVGAYRVICKIEDARLVVLVVRVGHRSEIYR